MRGGASRGKETVKPIPSICDPGIVAVIVDVRLSQNKKIKSVNFALIVTIQVIAHRVPGKRRGIIIGNVGAELSTRDDQCTTR